MIEEDIGQYSSDDDYSNLVNWAPCAKRRKLELQLEQEFQLEKEEERIVAAKQRRIQKRTRVKCIDFIKPDNLQTNCDEIEEIDDNTDEENNQNQSKETSACQHACYNEIDTIDDSNQNLLQPYLQQKKTSENNQPKQTYKSAIFGQLLQQNNSQQRQQRENIFVDDRCDTQQIGQQTQNTNFQKLREIWKDAKPQGAEADLGGWKSKGSGQTARNSGYVGKLNAALKNQKQAQDLFNQSGTTTSPESALHVTIQGMTWEGSMMKCRIETDSGQKMFLFLKSRVYQRINIELGHVITVLPPWNEIILENGEKVDEPLFEGTAYIAFQILSQTKIVNDKEELMKQQLCNNVFGGRPQKIGHIQT